MINGISQSGRYVQVSGGSSSNPYISPGAVGAGMLRWNPNMNCMEVSDGNTWKTLSMDYASVGLTAEAESLLDWAREQRQKEFLRQERIKNNPALQKAYEAIKRAEENFNLLEKFVEHDNDTEVQASP